ncbi:MAG: YlbF family regulator [Haloferacaceae archaeon]
MNQQAAPDETGATAHEDDPVALAQALGTALASSPEHEAFVEAEAAVEADEEAQRRIAEFERKRSAFVADRERGEATRGDLEELERLQSELHEIAVVAEYLEAKAELEATLDAVDDAISAPLAVDFGGEAGGCCMD